MAAFHISSVSSDPFYQQIKDSLRSRIVSGRLKPGALVPDERSLAVSLNVSRKTTRRALAELTEEGLLRRVRGRGTYVRETVGLQPEKREAVLIACAINPFDSLYYMKLFEGIIRAAAKTNLFTIVEQISQPYDTFVARLQKREALKGVLVVGVADNELLEQFLRMPVPVVLVDSLEPSPKPTFDQISHDVEPGVYRAVKYLQELGHRDIAFLGSTNSRGSNLQRLKGYLRAMSDDGCAARPELVIQTGYYPEAAYATTTRLLNEPSAPTAIVCISDELATGTVHAIKDFGWRIPEDISVVTVGDLGYFTSPPLSAVRLASEQMGAVAMQVLAMRVAHPTASVQSMVLPVEWIVRSSCGTPRVRIENSGAASQ
jgi:DNA-binding LacI/PurR family transcriptional regulator